MPGWASAYVWKILDREEEQQRAYVVLRVLEEVRSEFPDAG